MIVVFIFMGRYGGAGLAAARAVGVGVRQYAVPVLYSQVCRIARMRACTRAWFTALRGCTPGAAPAGVRWLG